MNAVAAIAEAQSRPLGSSIQRDVEDTIETMVSSLPNPKELPAEQRRGVIARYSAVLEGNFIYWMTGAYLSVSSDEAREIILDNLQEEVRDAHPLMLRRFALAAHAFPTDTDALSINDELNHVRLFVGRLSPVPILVMMSFFEGYIQRFMSFLADLAEGQGSLEREYTDVHGVCDIAHTAGLFKALDVELAIKPLEPGTDIFEGVRLLRSLMENVLRPAVAMAKP